MGFLGPVRVELAHWIVTATPPPLCPSLSTSLQSWAPTWVLEYTEPEISGTPVLLEVTDTPGGGGKTGGLAQLAAGPTPGKEMVCAAFLAIALQGNSGLFFQLRSVLRDESS